MKLKKVLSSILIILGCIMMLIGLLAFALPRINNQQLQLVLSSFESPSENPVIQFMNDGMNFAIENCFLMLLIGSAIMMTGILLTFSLRTDEAIAAAQRKQKSPAHAPDHSNYARPATPQESAEEATYDQPPQVNPFARYLKDDNLPKSTAVQSASPLAETTMEPDIQNEADGSQSDILHIWDELQQQPQTSDSLYIQPVRVEDDQAYRRPAAAPHMPAGQNNLPDPSPAQEPVNHPANEAVASTPALDVASTSSPARQPAGDQQRPAIRSTFRNAAEPVFETAAESAVSSVPTGTNVTPPLQPASRIKSTMGRKR